MSHYLLMVVHPADVPVEHLMAPYDENLEVAPYIAMTADEVQQKIAKAREYYARKNTDLAGKTDARIMKDWSGYDLDADGNALSTCNPQGHWDWCVVGGRYRCRLLLKPGATAPAVGSAIHPMERELLGVIYASCGADCPDEDEDPGLHEDENGDRWVNEARMGDIDWTRMRAFQKEAAAEGWEYHRDLLGQIEGRGDETPEKIAHLRALWLDDAATKDEYAANSEWSCYAVITPDGAWHQAPEMSYCANPDVPGEEVTLINDRARRAFARGFHAAFIANADPELIVTMVDCHI